MKKQFPRYIPQDSTPIERAGLPAIVYAYTSKDGKPAAISYRGSSSKNVWHYRFLTKDQRTKRIDQFFDDIALKEDSKLTRKVERATFRHDYKIGDILYSSWGYEQTNIDFYQVTATTKKTITVCQIKSTQTTTDAQFMSGEVTPRPYEYIPGKTFIRKVLPSGYIHLSSFESAQKFDGRPKHNSWYG